MVELIVCAVNLYFLGFWTAALIFQHRYAKRLESYHQTWREVWDKSSGAKK